MDAGLSLILATAAAWLGAAGASLFDLDGRRFVGTLTQLGSGALLAVAVFDIFPEASAHISWPALIAAAALGFALLWVIGAKVFPVCPSCSLSHFESAAANPERKTIIFLCVALGTHCILDGLLLTVDHGASAVSQTGLLAGLAVHKVPEGFALALLLYGAGLPRLKALGLACAVESLTIVGGLASLLFLASPPATAVSAIFAFIGGGFVYLVSNSWTSAESHGKGLWKHGWIAVEAASFASVGIFLLILPRLTSGM